MPIAERDYMKENDRGPEPGRRMGPLRLKFQNRGTFLFRLLVVVWLVYLTTRTHDTSKFIDRSIEISQGLRDATVEFFRSTKDVIFKGD